MEKIVTMYLKNGITPDQIGVCHLNLPYSLNICRLPFSLPPSFILVVFFALVVSSIPLFMISFDQPADHTYFLARSPT